MLAKGNGTPEVCALNLFRITRGEVPYDRIRGRDAVPIDAPSGQAIDQTIADAEWLLRTYEPRIDADAVDIDGTLGQAGDFGIDTTLRRREDG